MGTSCGRQRSRSWRTNRQQSWQLCSRRLGDRYRVRGKNSEQGACCQNVKVAEPSRFEFIVQPETPAPRTPMAWAPRADPRIPRQPRVIKAAAMWLTGDVREETNGSDGSPAGCAPWAPSRGTC